MTFVVRSYTNQNCSAASTSDVHEKPIQLPVFNDSSLEKRHQIFVL